MRNFRIVSLVCAALALGVFFRGFILSGFDALPGGPIDMRFNAAILEHWYRVFSGLEPWDSPNFFFPREGVLGYSDTWALAALPYSVLRFVGLDRYLSMFAIVATMGVIGGYATSVFLHRILNVSKLFSILGGVLFILSHGQFVSSATSLPQSQSMWLAPVIFYCLFRYLFREDKRSRAGWVECLTFAFLLGGMCYSWFYTGWFTCFILMIGLPVWGAYFLWREGLSRSVSRWFEFGRSHWSQLAAMAVCFGGWVGALAVTYMPTMIEFGRRKYEAISAHLPSLYHYFHVGNENVVWGWFVSRWIEPNVGEKVSAEFQYGVPYLVLGLFVASVFWLGRKLFDASRSLKAEEQVVLFLSLSTLGIWGLLLQVGESSIWKVVYELVPGAGSVRGVFRFNVMLSFSVIASGIYFFDALWRSGHVPKLLLLAIGVILPIENLDSRVASIVSRSEEMAFINGIAEPPSEIRDSPFYLKGPSRLQSVFSGAHRMWESQIDGIIVAQETNVPTVNGYSGFSPDGWRSRDIGGEDYIYDIGDWLFTRKIDQAIYSYDVLERVWREEGFAAYMENPDFFNGDYAWVKNGQPGLSYLIDGWGDSEDWGIWSVSDETELVLDLTRHRETGVRLIFHCIAMLCEKFPEQRVEVIIDDQLKATWSFKHPDEQFFGRVELTASELAHRMSRIVLRLPDATNPEVCDIMGDERRLGIGLLNVRMRPLKN